MLGCELGNHRHDIGPAEDANWIASVGGQDLPVSVRRLIQRGPGVVGDSRRMAQVREGLEPAAIAWMEEKTGPSHGPSRSGSEPRQERLGRFMAHTVSPAPRVFSIHPEAEAALFLVHMTGPVQEVLTCAARSRPRSLQDWVEPWKADMGRGRGLWRRRGGGLDRSLMSGNRHSCRVRPLARGQAPA